MELERLTTKQFELYQRFIYKRFGIKVNVSKVTLVSNRIRRRLKPSNCDNFDQYYRLISSPSGVSELAGFVDAITTNETSFFRTPSHFDWFKGEFIKQLVTKKQKEKLSRTLRVWSAACSTGEEPYSVAMCLAESMALLSGWTSNIVGTDISEAALKSAREACYSERTMQGLSAERIKSHFVEKEPGRWTLQPKIAAMVDFRNHNLLDPIPLPSFDAVFIRNVLIYFDRESKGKAIENLIQALAPGGYLVVGPSEGIYDMLSGLNKHSTFLYQKP
jgi:chemotaxis protein methyltransferase CheR